METITCGALHQALEIDRRLIVTPVLRAPTGERETCPDILSLLQQMLSQVHSGESPTDKVQAETDRNLIVHVLESSD